MTCFREGRFQYAGRPQKLLLMANSPQPVMCGATALSCGRWCHMARGHTGRCPIKMYASALKAPIKYMIDANLLSSYVNNCLMFYFRSFYPLRKATASPRQWAAPWHCTSWCCTAGRRSTASDHASTMCCRSWTNSSSTPAVCSLWWMMIRGDVGLFWGFYSTECFYFFIYMLLRNFKHQEKWTSKEEDHLKL